MTDPDASQSVLADDPITVPGQKFALISIVAPDKTNQRYENEHGQCALKIRGVFETKEEAQKHAQSLIRLDPLFDIMLVDLYRWVVIPPDPTALTQVEEIYQEQFLTDLISGHKQEQIKSKQFFEERRMMDALETDPLTSGSSSKQALSPVEEEPEAEIEADPKGKTPAS